MHLKWFLSNANQWWRKCVLTYFCLSFFLFYLSHRLISVPIRIYIHTYTPPTHDISHTPPQFISHLMNFASRAFTAATLFAVINCFAALSPLFNSCLMFCYIAQMIQKQRQTEKLAVAFITDSRHCNSSRHTGNKAMHTYEAMQKPLPSSSWVTSEET